MSFSKMVKIDAGLVTERLRWFCGRKNNNMLWHLYIWFHPDPFRFGGVIIEKPLYDPQK